MDEQGDFLNREVLFALEGIREEPERIIAKLLASRHEIDPYVRERLADALLGRLEGMGQGISLVAQGKRQKAWARTWLAKQRSVRRGREMMAKQAEGETYDDAARAVAKERGISVKTVVADVALAKRCAEWVRVKLQGRNGPTESDPNNIWPDMLESFYLRAAARKEDPDQVLRDNTARHAAAQPAGTDEHP